MNLAFDEEDWTPEILEEISEALSVVLIEEDEILEFIEWLDSTPDAER